ncbi:AMP-binding protein [Bacillus sp. T3]|uniref:AMP-binding protein n=1 Tax=Bacillus sp. T3 TaxID=467262 RepID=UPI00298171F7|nr:AMP-binding protein [Bacillus sp. T3]
MGNITEPYAKHALQFPNKIALQTQEEKITYHEWANLINKTARWLDSFGDEHKTLGIYLPNGVPFLQFFSGAAAAGWTAVLFDPRWNPIEIERRFAISRPSLFITSRILLEKVKHLCTNIIMIEDCMEEILSFKEILPKKINADLPFYMGFTSGTTGEPKAFIRGHESWIASFKCNRFDFHMNEQERVLIPGSLIHSHFLYGAVSTLYLGGTVSLLKKFTSKQALSIIQAQSITTMFVVPTMIHAFLKEDITISQPIKLISSGAKWEDRSKELIHKKFLQLTSFEFYGASELSFVTVLSQNENLIKPGSVGKPCYGVELQIRRNNLELANPFEIGKIYIRSNMLFLGYLQHQLPTIHSIVDSNGWVTVDDMGYLDQDGYLFIVGREKT